MIMEPEYRSYKSGNLLSEIWKHFSQRPDTSRSLTILPFNGQEWPFVCI